jgi:tetratricopeptide (TPR) repeat protein
VALSFPGEYRVRVERIAESLGRELGRRSVLYDRWHAAEFARPNLDKYLTRLYHDESDLLVIFLCREYDSKEWTGLEERSWRDLMLKKQDERIMFLRLDDAELSSVLGVDGYLDIRQMKDEDVAAAILSRLGPVAPASGPVLDKRPFQHFTAKLPRVNSLLIGREEELAFLDVAWADPGCNFVQVIAAGGTGKTALVDKWFRRHLAETDLFGWSFFSQGTKEDRQTSSEEFFAEIIRWLGLKVEPGASVWNKASAVAERLRDRRVLLILDGVEPLQEGDGRLRDLLLQELETENRGMVVCTTRVRIDISDDGGRVRSKDLDNLKEEQGAQYLGMLGVKGTEEELQEASREYWNHALALTLLGTYLVDFCKGDIRRRVEIPRLTEDEDASRVIAAYERMFAGKPEADVLRGLGYFDRPAEPEALRLVLPAMDEGEYRTALKRLHRARLILTADPSEDVDCHPLVRECFEDQAAPEGHARLYEHYRDAGKEFPETLEEMRPLFWAVYHGCKAGRHQEVLLGVYRNRILRGKQFYLIHSLGAYGAVLSLLANCFELAWSRPIRSLRQDLQAWMLSSAGFTLRGLGRLADAVVAIQAAAEGYVKLEDAANAATAYGNLSEGFLTVGRVADAIGAARKAIEFADKTGDPYRQVVARSQLGDALSQAGDVLLAEEFFAEAERMQRECQPDAPILYSVRGYEYCDLLLDRGQTTEVIRRASQTLLLHEQRRWLLDIGLDHLSLGRAVAAGAESVRHINEAEDYLRRAGTLPLLPLVLLAKGTDRDLEEVCRIATRSGMRLHLTDYHLAMARKTGERKHLDEAARLIEETGYHRRDGELAELKARFGA